MADRGILDSMIDGYRASVKANGGFLHAPCWSHLSRPTALSEVVRSEGSLFAAPYLGETLRRERQRYDHTRALLHFHLTFANRTEPLQPPVLCILSLQVLSGSGLTTIAQAIPVVTASPTTLQGLSSCPFFPLPTCPKFQPLTALMLCPAPSRGPCR